MPIYAIDGVVPVVHPAAFVHPSAVLIGDVIVSAGCYVAPPGIVYAATSAELFCWLAATCRTVV